MRPVIAAAALAVWLCTAIAALAQDAARLPLVGVLQVVNVEPSTTMLRDALKALGYIDGETFRLDFRFAEGDPARVGEGACSRRAERDCRQRGCGNTRSSERNAHHPDRSERQ